MPEFRSSFRDNGPERTKDMTGQRVGLLTVQRQAPSMGMNARWFCLCDCGGTRVMTGGTLRQALKAGSKSSCGCYNARKRAAGA